MRYFESPALWQCKLFLRLKHVAQQGWTTCFCVEQPEIILSFVAQHQSLLDNTISGYILCWPTYYRTVFCWPTQSMAVFCYTTQCTCCKYLLCWNNDSTMPIWINLKINAFHNSINHSLAFYFNDIVTWTIDHNKYVTSSNVSLHLTITMQTYSFILNGIMDRISQLQRFLMILIKTWPKIIQFHWLKSFNFIDVNKIYECCPCTK